MATAMTAAIIAAVIGTTMINRGLMRNRKKAGALIWRRSIQARWLEKLPLFLLKRCGSRAIKRL
jgi:hypothetical protein